MEPTESVAPTANSIELELTVRRFEGRLAELAGDLRSAKELVSSKNSQIIKLEAENLRLKMTRTDKELSTEVDGLRREVGLKHKELVDLKRRLEVFQDNEKVTLHRAVAAEQKIVIMQTTMTTMQKARDAAHLEVEKHDRERLEAVRNMVDYDDRMKKALARVKELEPKNKGSEVPKAARK